MLKFLNVTIDHHAIDCVLKAQEGRFKRKNRNEMLDFELYSNETRAFIQRYEKAVQIAIDMRERRIARAPFELRKLKDVYFVPGPADPRH